MKEFKKLLVEAEVVISFKSFKMGRIGKKIGGFFKKVWGGIKKGASWVYKKVLTPIGHVAKKVIGKFGGTLGTAAGTAAGSLVGNPAAGAAIGGAIGRGAQALAGGGN